MSRRRKALIVVEKPERRERLARLCNQMGLQVDFAVSVKEGLGFLKRPYDLVVSDAALPDGDGLEILRRVEGQWNRITSRVLISVCDPSTAQHCPVDEILRPTFSTDAAEELLMDVLKRRGLWKTQVHDRFQVKGIAELSIPGFGNLSGRIMDVSLGGMFIGIPTRTGLPSVDDICHFDVDFSRQSKKFGGTGIIRWVRDASSNKAMAGVGVQFCSVNEGRLSELLESLGKQSQAARIVAQDDDSEVSNS